MINRLGKAIASTWHWLGGPWRSFKLLMVTLVNLDRRRIRALFSIAMLGGIVSLSFQNIGLILLVRSLLKDAAPGSLFGQMALNQQFWNNAIMALFCVIAGLVVWGADYFTAKYKDAGIEAGSKEALQARTEGARRVEEAASEEREEIEQEVRAAPDPEPDFEEVKQ